MLANYSISIIIPNRDGVQALSETVDSLLANQTLAGFEIVVANDGASAGVWQKVLEYKRKNINIKSVDIAESKGSYFARNRAIEIAQGNILVFFDSGLKVSGNWYKDLAPLLDKYDYIAGEVIIVAPENPTLGQRFEAKHGFPFKRYLETRHFGGAGYLIVKRKVFDTVGLFEERVFSGGDYDFGQRVYQAGFSQYYYDQAPAYHMARNFKSQFKKMLRINKGIYDLNRLYPDIYTHNIRVKNIFIDLKIWLVCLWRYKTKAWYNFTFWEYVYTQTVYYFSSILVTMIIMMAKKRKLNL